MKINETNGFNDVLNVSASVLQNFVPEPSSSFSLGNVVNGVASAVGGGNSNLMGIDPEYQALLLQQMKLQEQTQRVNLQSNNEKTRHEARMAPIRNIRA